MDDFATELVASGRAFDSPDSSERREYLQVSQMMSTPDTNDKAHREPTAMLAPETPTPQRTGLRGGLAAIREKANMQDRLVEK